MIQALQVLEIIISILLIIFILIQNKNVTLNLSSMGWWMGDVVKRGSEKMLHNITIGLSALFILNSVLLFVVS